MFHKYLSSGERQVLDFAFPGDFIGYQSPLHEPMGHTAESVTEVALCVFPKHEFDSLLRRHPDLAVRLAELSVRDLSRTQRYLANIGGRSARRSVAYFLVLLYQRVRLFTSYYEKNGDVVLPIAQIHLADALGITNVYINKILHDFQNEGLIVCTNGRVAVVDPKGLSSIAHAGPEPAAA